MSQESPGIMKDRICRRPLGSILCLQIRPESRKKTLIGGSSARATSVWAGTATVLAHAASSALASSGVKLAKTLSLRTTGCIASALACCPTSAGVVVQTEVERPGWPEKNAPAHVHVKHTLAGGYSNA